jgi:ATP-dependent DNA ligase
LLVVLSSQHAQAPRPALVHSAPAPPTCQSAAEGDDWAHEVKYDGYRLHARLAGREVKLLNRTGLDWTDRYQTTAEALSKLRLRDAYLDGELYAKRADGTTSFAELQAATDSRRTQTLIYFVFDLLFVNGKDLMSVGGWTPVSSRMKAMLERA